MTNRRAYLDLTLAMILVGSSVVVSKVIVSGFSVFLASELRFAIASLILIPVMLKTEGGLASVRSIARREWFILFLQAFTGVFLFAILLMYGLKTTSASEGAIITSTTPAVVALISFGFLRERLTLSKVLAITLAVLGILVTGLAGSPQAIKAGSILPIGGILIFGAVIGEALFTVFLKILPEGFSPLRTSAIVTGMGVLMFLPFAIYEAAQCGVYVPDRAIWASILYYGIVATAVAYMLWFRGVPKVPASTAAAFTRIMPVSAVVLSYVFLREAFSWAHVAGGMLVLLGIAFVSMDTSTA